MAERETNALYFIIKWIYEDKAAEQSELAGVL